MTDWLDNLSGPDREEWDRLVESFRRDAVAKITDSHMVVSIVPPSGFDVKFALELGASIMLDKPLLILVPTGQEVPPKLRAVADAVVEGDVDTEEGQEALREALEASLRKLK